MNMPLYFKLDIELGNDRMKNYNDIARALKKTADKVRVYARVEPGETGRIMDENGNSVGRWTVMKDDPGDDA